MVSGSGLMAQWSPAEAPGRRRGGGGGRRPWGRDRAPLSHEPLTINNRLINKSFDYIIYRYQVFWYVQIHE